MARPDGPGSCLWPDPSVPVLPYCDPSREWRPIAEAIEAAKQNDGWLGPYLFGKLRPWGWEMWVGQCDAFDWWLGRDGSGGCYSTDIPSHFMPLPALPDALAGEAAQAAETWKGSVHEHAAPQGATPKPDAPIPTPEP